MRSAKTKMWKSLPAVALFTVSFAVLAAAQQYEILRADYGYGNQRVDVTQRLREVVSNNAAFRMGNSTFGVDPSHGNLKTLRVFVRSPRGETRTFEYREGSTVDSSQFVGAGGGNWGGGESGYRSGDGDSGEYTILHAEYGTERNHVDVTDRLKELARADITFRMGNSTFGVDPDPGVIKTLRIYARGPDGQERMFEYRESSTVDGSQFKAWGRGEWGNEGWTGGWAGGGFHDHDRDDRDRDRDRAGDAGEYIIVRAEYGTERNRVDVTDRLRELARSDRSFRMGNSTFGVDPDHGRIKTLRIYARGRDGQERMFEYRESSTVDGAQFKGWGGGEWGR